MWEFEIFDNSTNEHDIIFGYSWADACRRAHLDPEKTECLFQEYVD